MTTVIKSSRTYDVPNNLEGIHILGWIADNIDPDISNMIIKGLKLQNIGFFHEFKNVVFENCEFTNVNLGLCKFSNCRFNACKFTGNVDYLKNITAVLVDCTINDTKKTNVPTNEELEAIVKGKVYSLPNKDYVKIKATCDFCHKDYFQIMHRCRARKILRCVPNCDKLVCDSCYKFYDIEHKERGNRTYGYHGPLSFFRTPMDKQNTAILGLEMEFEGDFYGWKELQDAHQGNLHFGYDSSVRGENELSWDCGSYSWWKYLAPLKNVCDVLKKHGGSEGDTAGIHIHVSRPDVRMQETTHLINSYCRVGIFHILMRAVSMRSNVERFNMYADLSASETQHHAAISYNSHGTCEFRVFNSSLDSKLILRHLKFCKEFFNLVAENTPKEKILQSFSKATKLHIKNCAKIQLDKGFILDNEYKELLKEIQ